MESFQHRGIWWLPGDESPKLVGTLSFDPGKGGRLELSELITDHSHPPIINFSRKYDVIYGVAAGAQVTLKSCHVSSEHNPVPDLRVYELVVSYIHMNHQFADAEELIVEESSLSYSQITFGLTHLHEWMGQQLFNEENGAFAFDYFTPIEAELTDSGDKIIFCFANRRERTSTTRTLRSEARIVVRPKDKLHFDDYFLSIYLHLPNLLTLAAGKPNFPFNIQGKTADGKMVTDIFYQLPGFTEQRKNTYNHDMLFTFDDIKDDLAKYLSNWMKKAADLWPVYVQFSKAYLQNDNDTETKFMNMAQALEAYYRYLKGDKKTKLEDMLLHVCNEVKAHYFGVVEQLLGDVEGFCKKAALGRHNLSHHPTKRIPNAADWRERPVYVRKMLFLLRLCLLIELELPPATVKPRIYSNDDFNYLIKT